MHKSLNLTTALLIALAAPLAAQASSQLAIDKGCYSCHGVNLRGEAPGFERLAAKLGKHKGDAAAEQKIVNKLQHGDMLERIDAHERLSPESAKTLVHWLVDGAH